MKNFDYQQAIAEQMCKQQAVGAVGSGLAAGQAVPTPTDTMGSVLKVLIDQVAELRDLSNNLAATIGGPVPQEAVRGSNTEASLVGILRGLSNNIGDSLNELRRAHRFLQ